MDESSLPQPTDQEAYSGFVIGCYSQNGYLYHVPLTLEDSHLKEILHRESAINGEPLTQAQFRNLQFYINLGNEVIWYDELEYYVEGVNLR